jgi:hypothetical protein
MAAISELCRRGLVLDAGKLIFDGSAKEAIQLHTNVIFSPQNSQSHIFNLAGALDRRSPQGKFLQSIELSTDNEQPVLQGIPVGASLKVRVHFSLPHPTAAFNVGLGFNNAFGQRVFTAHTVFDPSMDHSQIVGAQVAVCEIPSLTLLPGDYVLRAWLDIGKVEADLIDSAARIKVLESDYYGSGNLPNDGAFVLEQRWSLGSPL